MIAFETPPPVPLGDQLGAPFDSALIRVVNPRAPMLIVAIQRASRYANLGQAGRTRDVNMSRRVMTLGITETTLSDDPAYEGLYWARDWILRLDPDIAKVLRKEDRADRVRDALVKSPRIMMNDTLAAAVQRAREIAQATGGGGLIDIRHLVYAIAENPGRAFTNFNVKPTALQLTELRALIVEHVARAPEPGEDPSRWQTLFEEFRDPNLAEPASSKDPEGSDVGGEKGAPIAASRMTKTPGSKTSGLSARVNEAPPEGPVRTPPARQRERFRPSQQPSTIPGQAHGSAPQLSSSAEQQQSSAQATPDGTAVSPSSRPAAEPQPGPRATEIPAPTQPQDETVIDFVLDDAERDLDQLERSVLAIGLARRLHAIWRRTNQIGAAEPADSRAAHEGSRAAFVVHLDAPWGGGKTTFANFLSGVLNPLRDGVKPPRFLTSRYGDADLGGVFLEDPPLNRIERTRMKKTYPADARRPWVVVYFNAWQMEHIRPPWWAFYQVIRSACFGAIRSEGARAWNPLRPTTGKAPWFERWGHWLSLWGKEFVWRVTNPKIYTLLLTALISLALVGMLVWTHWFGVTQGKTGPSAGFLLGSPVALLLTGLGSITGLWGLGALVTESIVPGTDTLAERLNLGNGDPFGRFRRHFARTMQRIRRPVLVVIDDLDRCEPGFVVDLIRGIQTLLRSPRVTFVILGDREWIERAFESKHEEMSKLDVGPEQSFGARFVEKAIQMSFILPALGDEARLGYVRHVVLGDRAKRKAPALPSAAEQAAKAQLREFVNAQAARSDVGLFDSGPILQRLSEEYWNKIVGAEDENQDPQPLGTVLDAAGLTRGSEKLEQLVNDTLAIRAASDEGEQAVKHEIEDFARFFPANPRQIKRIINSITIYYAVAIQRPDVRPDRRFRAQLAAWVILMTEWPQTWRLLASYPDLAAVLNAEDPEAAMRNGTLLLPGSAEATARALEPIRADADLMALITGKGLDVSHQPLEAEQVRTLAQLTPLHSRMRRLGEGASTTPDSHHAS